MSPFKHVQKPTATKKVAAAASSDSSSGSDSEDEKVCLSWTFPFWNNSCW